MIPAFVKELASGGVKSAGTQVGSVFSGPTTAGNLIVARILFDNFTTASKPIVSSIAKMAGETNNWVFLGAARSTSTSAGAFVSGEMWCIQTTIEWAAAPAYLVTLDSSVTQKAVMFTEFSGTQAVLRNTVGTAYSTTTTPASAATSGSTVANDLGLAFIFGSNVAAAQVGTVTTAGGTWSAAVGVGTTGGSAATNNFGVGQYKVLTGNATLTVVNNVGMTAGNGAIAACLQPIPDPSITQAAYQFFDDAGTESGAAALAAQNTAVTGNISAGDGYGALRVRLQSTTAIAVPSFTDFQLQWDKNSSGTWAPVQAPSGAALLDSYASSNQSANAVVHSTFDVSGQSFVGDDKYVTQISFWLMKTGAPPFSVCAQIYAASGSLGTGPALATSSTTIVASTLTTSFAWYSFDFATPFRVAAGTTYVAALAMVTPGTGDASNNVTAGMDNSSPTHSGFRTTRTSAGTWSSSTSDQIFEVYTAAGGGVIPYDNPNLTEGAATTNRLTGGTGTFTAGKVSEIGHVTNVGWAGNNYTEILYSLKILAASFVNGDAIRFRVLLNGVTTGMTYTQTPTINITLVAPPVNLVVQDGIHVLWDDALSLPQPNDGFFAVTSDNVTLTEEAPPQTWTGSTGTAGVAGQTDSFVAGAVTWAGGSTATAGVTGVSGEFFTPTPQTWTGGSTGTVGVTAVSDSFVGGATAWTGGSTATAGATGVTGSFTAGAVAWSGSTGTAGVAGISAPLVGGPVTWIGSTATVGATGVSGAFAADAIVWAGSTATAGATGSTGAFTGGSTTWTGESTATAGAAGTSGSFAGGPVTWVGTTAATIGVAGVSGTMSESNVPQTWIGSTATVGATGQTGLFVSTITWVGSTATAGAAGATGAFVQGVVTWVGTTATIGATGVSAPFVPAPITWTGGSLATAGVAGVSAPFVEANTPQTWVGTAATVGAVGVSGAFVAGGVTWSGSTATAGVAGVSGSFVGGATVWSGSTATAGVTGVSGAFSWGGSAGTVGVAALSGTFLPGATTWIGSTAAVGVTGVSGVFSAGSAWAGSVAVVGVAGTSGTLVGAAVTWVGSTGVVGVAGTSGTFTSQVTWIGSAASVGVTGVSGQFIVAQTWVGSTATLGISGTTGVWTEVFGLWEGSLATFSLVAISGTWGTWSRTPKPKLPSTRPPNRYWTPAKAYRLAHPQNYVTTVSTHVPEPNPYTDKAWAKQELVRQRLGITRRPAGKTAEEIGRMGQDIDWRWLGTKGD